jgi:hypothetical protein
VPVKRRLSKKRREPWTEAHRIALGSGQRYLGVFGGHRHPWGMDEAREAWAALGEDIRHEYSEKYPTLRPWGWWHFDYGIEPPQGKSRQRRYLHEHNLFTPAEAAMIEGDPGLLVLKPWHRDW